MEISLASTRKQVRLFLSFGELKDKYKKVTNIIDYIYDIFFIISLSEERKKSEL